MQAEGLTISVLYGTGNLRSDIQKILESMPQLRVLHKATNPENFRNLSLGEAPDMVLVDLDSESGPPQWLEDLTQALAQTAVLLCSHNRDPDFLIRAMQMGIREFLPLPLQKADLEAAVERLWVAKKRLRSAHSQQGRLLVITGHKGGVGSTTIAVNLAMALAESTPEPVALVDLGRPFPDVGNFLDQSPSHTMFDLVQNLASLDHAFLQRIMQPYEGKLAVLHGYADFKEQESLDLESMDRIFSLLKGLYRWIIVDLSHWLDGFFMHVIREADVVLMLTELTIPDLKNLKKFWPVVQEMQQWKQRVRIVVNRYQRSNGLQLSDLEQVIQQPAFDLLPCDYPGLSEAITKGVPLGVVAPRSKLYRGLCRLARRLREGNLEPMEEAVASPASRRTFWLF